MAALHESAARRGDGVRCPAQWQQELQRRVEESRRRDLERQARAAEREAEEARRMVEAQRTEQAVHFAGRVGLALGPETLPKALHPRIALKPIDREVLFPGQALPTLLDYVRLLKDMGRGDPLKAMASAGIDMATWAAVANAWGQVLVGRLELGLRFGELLAAPWE
jgi:hypothetical protein